MQALRPGLRAAVALLVVASAARGQGFVVSKRAERVETPEARALVVWRDGVERLLLEITVRGAAPEECAWVIPLPAAPTRVEAAEAGPLETLDLLARPLIEGRRPDSLDWFWTWPVALLVTFARRWLRVAGLVVVGAAFLVATQEQRGFMAVDHLVRTPPRPPATVAASVRVEGDLAALEAEGFRVPREAAPPPGAPFVAVRMRSGGAVGGAWRSPPVLLEFPSGGPLLPGGAQPGTRLSLHVAAPDAVRCPDLGAGRRARLVRATPERPSMWAGTPLAGEIPVSEPRLVALLSGAGTLTSFLGPVPPGGVPPPAPEPFSALLPFRYTGEAALARAAGMGALSTILALLALRLAMATIAWGRPFSLRAKLALWGLALGVGLLTGASFAAATPVAPVRRVNMVDEQETFYRHVETAQAVENASDPREAARRAWAGRANPLTAEPVVEEASPFNYVLRAVGGRNVYVFHDADGAPWRSDGDRVVPAE
jgi:hypothetical protein